jgi:hypothetical protein
MTYLTADTIARFWEKVDQRGGADACWNWTASLTTDGYGRFKAKGVVQSSSRIALQIALDKPLWGDIVCHTCHNRKCCNPKHLYAGTQSQNMQDRWDRRFNEPGITSLNTKNHRITT